MFLHDTSLEKKGSWNVGQIRQFNFRVPGGGLKNPEQDTFCLNSIRLGPEVNDHVLTEVDTPVVTSGAPKRNNDLRS